MQGRIDSWTRLQEHNLHFACRSRAHCHQHVLDSGRPDVHPTQDEQVIGAPDAADAYTRTTTNTGISPDYHTITRAEPNEGDAFTVYMREDQFTLHFWPIKWQGLRGLRVNHLENGEVGSRVMHATAWIVVAGS